MTTMLPESPRPAVARPRARWRLGALLTFGVVLAVALLAIWSTGSGPGAPADPESASRQGARALAEVLRDQGVNVDVVRTIQGIESAPVGPTTTVVVSSFDYLGEAAARRLADHASAAQRLVLLEPGDLALADLEVALQVTARGSLESTADCQTAVADADDRIDAAGTLYRSIQDDSEKGPILPVGATGCFVDEEAGALLVTLPATDGVPETLVLGSSSALTNSMITRASHAALGLRALGSSPHLVWYVPSVSDLDVEAPGGEQLRSSDRGIPQWFAPGVLLVGLAFVAFALARGRRLGRIVTEPLPVVVRAVETTEARGRLYRRASDRGRAALSLRAGTRRRLAARLGVPKEASTSTLAQAVAQSTARDPAEIRDLLDGKTPHSDGALVLLADQLAQLEENVRSA
jgi:hypothetical protein